MMEFGFYLNLYYNVGLHIYHEKILLRASNLELDIPVHWNGLVTAKCQLHHIKLTFSKEP